jgi:hypothetical protein
LHSTAQLGNEEMPKGIDMVNVVLEAFNADPFTAKSASEVGERPLASAEPRPGNTLQYLVAETCCPSTSIMVLKAVWNVAINRPISWAPPVNDLPSYRGKSPDNLPPWSKGAIIHPFFS